MGRKTEEAAEVAAFALAHKVSERTARNHRGRNTVEWRSFLAERARGAAQQVTSPDVDRAKKLVEQSWMDWKVVSARYSKEAVMCDPKNVAALERAVSGAMKRYHEAVKSLEEVMRMRREVVPAERVWAIKREMAPLGSLILSLESNIAGRLSENARAEFAEAFETVAPEWNAGIDKIIVYIEELLTC